MNEITLYGYYSQSYTLFIDTKINFIVELFYTGAGIKRLAGFHYQRAKDKRGFDVQ